MNFLNKINVGLLRTSAYPCPMCGRAPRVDYEKVDRKGFYFIRGNCGCFIEAGLDNFVISYSVDELVTQSWNRFVRRNIHLLLIPHGYVKVKRDQKDIFSNKTSHKKSLNNILKTSNKKTFKFFRDKEGVLFAIVNPDFFNVIVDKKTIVPKDHIFNKVITK